jgi:hypothetical protein
MSSTTSKPKFVFSEAKIALVSTANIRPQDGALMDDEGAPFRIAEADVRTGCFFYASRYSGDLKELAAFGFSTEFCEIMWQAGQQGFAYVRFDADCDPAEGAPTFEWE